MVEKITPIQKEQAMLNMIAGYRANPKNSVVDLRKNIQEELRKALIAESEYVDKLLLDAEYRFLFFNCKKYFKIEIMNGGEIEVVYLSGISTTRTRPLCDRNTLPVHLITMIEEYEELLAITKTEINRGKT